MEEAAILFIVTILFVALKADTITKYLFQTVKYSSFNKHELMWKIHNLEHGNVFLYTVFLDYLVTLRKLMDKKSETMDEL